MGCTGLDEYTAAVTDLVGRAQSPRSLVEAIAPLKRRLLAADDLVPERFFEGLADIPYTRNLLYADPADRFTVMAVVWGAGRETPVHDHHTWGVVGSYRREISVIDYAADGHGALIARPTVTMTPGEVARIVPPRDANIHKMRNAGERPAVTIHTYGDPARLCRVYDPKTGRATERQLKFHHAL